MKKIIFPQKFLQKYKQILPSKEFKKFITFSQKPLRKSIRVNTLKISIKNFQKIAQKKNWQLTKIPWCNEGFWIERKNKDIPLGKTPEHSLGLFFIQEASSMIPSQILFWKNEFKKDQKILDLCAAPGAKTTQIASLMQNNNLLFANEFSASRIKKLAFNLTKCAVENCLLYHKNSYFFEKNFPENFDKILVDAPCTGEGTIRKDKNALKNWNQKKINLSASLQKEILFSAFKALKENGELVYSTCTLSPEENEEIITELLKNFPQASLIDLSKFLKNSPALEKFKEKKFNHKIAQKCLRIWPHLFDSEGFFIAKIKKDISLNIPLKTKKKKEKNHKKRFQKISTSVFKTLEIFLKENFYFEIKEIKERLFQNNEKIFLFPQNFNNDNFKDFDKIGILLASIYPKEIKLSHQTALCLGKFFSGNRIINLSNKEMKKYFLGFDLEKENFLSLKKIKKGQVLLLYQNFPLGWGKIINEKIKNLLPKNFVQEVVNL